MNRVVLVSGGNKGIGKAICKKILETQPDCQVLLGSRDEERGSAAVSSIISTLPPSSSSRITSIPLDVSSPSSIASAFSLVSQSYPEGLYAIVNNAGVGFGRTIKETVTTNTLGPKRVNDAFIPLLKQEGARIVNIASASGPNFVSGLQSSSERAWYLDDSVTWPEIDSKIKSTWESPDYDNTAYGFSKALLNLYTLQLSKSCPDLIVNSCTPGWIATDLTAGMGATNSPEMGTKAPLHCLFGDLEGATGWYFGSDAVRSPMDKYREPGSPPYQPS
ncbi:hypothetical protein TrCOL_g1333 [Triparma columacea]|nr:hypothetical protein TrCOL_g1333 [Triparma columacea]